MDNRRVLSTILILFFLLSRPDPRGPVPVYEHERQRQIAEEYRTIAYFSNSSYGDFNSSAGRWLPLTGLKEEDGYAWDLLPVVQDKAREQLQFVLRDSGLLGPDVDDAELPPLSSDANITSLSLPVYHNVTGRARGDFVRRKPPETARAPSLNLTSIAMTYDYFTHAFARNITADHGSISLSLHEEEGQHLILNGVEAREIKAEMEIKTEESMGETWFLRLFGVHFPASGGIILSTTSEKFAGLSALPHFALSKDGFELARQLLNQSISEAVSAKRNPPMNFFPWSSLPHGGNPMSFPAPKCEYIAYLQQHPPRIKKNPAQGSLLKQIEDELRFPIGAPIPDPPPMVFSSVMFSPDCGFVLESKSSPAFSPSDNLYLSGPKQEQYSKYVSRFIMIIAAVLTSQLSLLMRQMKESSTPSTRSRISFYMIAMMSIGDALFITFVLLALFTETSYLLLIAMSFLAFFSVSFLGMKFQIEIWSVQAPERRENERQSAAVQASRSSPPAPQATGGSQTLPLPATATRSVDTGATPIILPPDQDAPAETPTPRPAATGGNDTGSDAGSMYTRFYLVLFGLVIFSSWAMFWPDRLGEMYIYGLSFVYLSFWTPQIYRNIMRNCRKALRWEFVIGQSILRLFPFLYFYFVRENVLFLEPDTNAIFALVIWVWIQAWTLASQDVLGPRFFVPKGWAPPAYDYHPLLRDTSASGSGEDIESGGTLPIDFLRAEERDAPANARDGDKDKPSGGKDRARKVFDCAICMQDIDVPILTSSSATGSAAHLFSRRTYMVTPCRHIFHSTCLESWMRLRLQCPICRESIPPI